MGGESVTTILSVDNAHAWCCTGNCKVKLSCASSQDSVLNQKAKQIAGMTNTCFNHSLASGFSQAMKNSPSGSSVSLLVEKMMSLTSFRKDLSGWFHIPGPASGPSQFCG